MGQNHLFCMDHTELASPQLLPSRDKATSAPIHSHGATHGPSGRRGNSASPFLYILRDFALTQCFTLHYGQVIIVKPASLALLQGGQPGFCSISSTQCKA